MLKIQGSVSHPRLLFLHGFLGCALDWDPVIQKLKSRYACISFDLPCPNTIKVILTWLDELALSPYVLVGYSMGGRIALMLERERPDLFSQQILLSAHPGLSSDHERERREREEKIWLEKLSTMPFESFLDDWYAQPLFSTLTERRTLFQKVRERRLLQKREDWSYFLSEFALSKQPEFTDFSLPTLFAYGEEDLKYAALYRRLKCVKKIARAGHALHLENPSACAELICEVVS